MQKNKKNVVIFFGGASFESEISVLTGVFACNVLKDSYNVIPVYILPSGEFITGEELFRIQNYKTPLKKCVRVYLHGKTLRKEKGNKTLCKIDCALNCCHGGLGEGGGLSALLKIHTIPLASPDFPLSALFMDKALAKRFVLGMGIPTLPFSTLKKSDMVGGKGENLLQNILKEVGLPLIIKPARLGSSIGIKVVQKEEELTHAIEESFAFDEELLIEKYEGEKQDINCAVYGVNGEVFVSDCERPLSQEEILSFDEKYRAGGMMRRCEFPAKISKEAEKEIKSITKKLYQELNFTGIIRADFLLCGDKVYFNELNTVPGSLAYYLFTEKISGAKKLFSSVIEDAMREKPTVKYTPTGILQELSFSGGTKGAKV